MGQSFWERKEWYGYNQPYMIFSNICHSSQLFAIVICASPHSRFAHFPTGSIQNVPEPLCLTPPTTDVHFVVLQRQNGRSPPMACTRASGPQRLRTAQQCRLVRNIANCPETERQTLVEIWVGLCGSVARACGIGECRAADSKTPVDTGAYLCITSALCTQK